MADERLMNASHVAARHSFDTTYSLLRTFGPRGGIATTALRPNEKYHTFHHSYLNLAGEIAYNELEASAPKYAAAPRDPRCMRYVRYARHVRYRYAETPQLREILTELAWDMHFIKEEGTRRSGVVGKEKAKLSETLVRCHVPTRTSHCNHSLLTRTLSTYIPLCRAPTILIS